MHKVVLYFILKPPYKDLHPPTAISSEMQDISEKKIIRLDLLKEVQRLQVSGQLFFVLLYL